MTIPRFSAEATLYRTDNQYIGTVDMTVHTVKGMVTPQAPRCHCRFVVFRPFQGEICACCLCVDCRRRPDGVIVCRIVEICGGNACEPAQVPPSGDVLA